MSDELPPRLKAILETEAIWVEPSLGLEERIQTLASGGGYARPATRLRRWLPVTVSLAILLVGTAVTFGRPDWQLDLMATAQVPGASALVSGWNDDEGTRLRFDVNGLPAPPPGSYYEIWLTSDDGLHVSGGSFTGNGVLTTMVAVQRRDFPRIWITLEPIDEDSSPSPETVFDTEA